MFKFLRKRKAEHAKHEALAIGSEFVETINITLEKWRASCLETRREMLEHSFTDRLVNLVPDVDLELEMAAEIEALALTKNWIERVPDYAAEFTEMLDQETINFIELMNIEDNVQEHITRNISEVTLSLEEALNNLIAEELVRRGEMPSA